MNSLRRFKGIAPTLGQRVYVDPATCVRRLSEAQIEQLHYSAEHYVRLKDVYLAEA
jgi:carbonic anhydrase/acetyltransferase-like protein (isoleucine patch superfamily)